MIRITRDSLINNKRFRQLHERYKNNEITFEELYREEKKSIIRQYKRAQKLNYKLYI